MSPPNKYRPWGKLEWVLDHGPTTSWNLIGAINTEDRSLAVWRSLLNSGILTHTNLLQITNPGSRFKTKADDMLEKRRELFLQSGGRDHNLSDFDLIYKETDPLFEFVEKCLGHDGANVLLDVSSMPKRFFFPILKFLLRSKTVENLLVSYAVPKGYTDSKLALNCHAWDHVPTFSGDCAHDKTEMLIVNVGFEPMGLPDEITEGDTREIKLLFPFPAPPSSVRRAWGFVKTLQDGRNPDTLSLFHTDAKDVSDAFDRLKSLTENGARRATLAPFGPKPISVAMCLFATLANSEVFYTQPSAYHPEYSTGVADTYAYWIRMNGRDLYER